MFKENKKRPITQTVGICKGIDQKLKDQYLNNILSENPRLKSILQNSDHLEAAEESIKQWVISTLNKNPDAYSYYQHQHKVAGREVFEKLSWSEIAAIRILDYLDRSGARFKDQNLRLQEVTTHPFNLLRKEARGIATAANEDFMADLMHLFRQFNATEEIHKPSTQDVLNWMDRHPAGIEEEIIAMREKNKKRILKVIIRQIDKAPTPHSRYHFDEGMSNEAKMERALNWWNDHKFHLKFAIRNPEQLNDMLGHTLDTETMEVLNDAKNAGIPFFVNPYYLSLVNVDKKYEGSDLAIRDYMVYSRKLINEFGHIVAWEKEDIVEPGLPNAAGWILPSQHNIHRRYPEVSILIPDTVGRACGGLCVSCQRMYDFQSGHLNFDLDKLKPKESWSKKLDNLMRYFENDAQLRDVLITGGDALMSSDKSLKTILEAVYKMAQRKIEANQSRAEGEKYAEMLRVRLGTRLPVYLPQRITPELIQVLADFKAKARKIGLKQFVIQTHFESAMEITPESREGILRLQQAGWMITNQQVFTTAASRRGHTAKLRKVLNDIGVLTYYTFSVKGYQENSHNFATNARAVQEQMEEKALGLIPESYNNYIAGLPMQPTEMIDKIEALRKESGIPFLATDRNVINLPGVGKSLTYRVIGITEDGRRILEFDHDATRWHSPVIHKMGKVIIIESKSVAEYLRQLETMGENPEEYTSIYGYSIGETEPRQAIYEYPEYDFKTTDTLTNFENLS